MVDSNTTLNELYDMAKASLHDVKSEEVFIVNDLFRGFEWQRIERKKRTNLGKMFMAFAQNEGSTQLEILGKTAQNQQMYKKI